jgi:hypothetical protein
LEGLSLKGITALNDLLSRIRHAPPA